MNKNYTDVDIDFADRAKALSVLPHVPASMINQGNVVKHNTGIYFQGIPVNPLNDLASIQYTEAEELGYFKVDFLNNSIYGKVRDIAHLDELVSREPIWELLDEREIVSELAHIHDHFDIVDIIKPKSVIDLAVVLALIRPGKRHLLRKERSVIDREIWEKPFDGGYHFKKAHSVSYAVSIVVQLNLLAEYA